MTDTAYFIGPVEGCCVTIRNPHGQPVVRFTLPTPQRAVAVRQQLFDAMAERRSSVEFPTDDHVPVPVISQKAGARIDTSEIRV